MPTYANLIILQILTLHQIVIFYFRNIPDSIAHFNCATLTKITLKWRFVSLYQRVSSLKFLALLLSLNLASSNTDFTPLPEEFQNSYFSAIKVWVSFSLARVFTKLNLKVETHWDVGSWSERNNNIFVSKAKLVQYQF